MQRKIGKVTRVRWHLPQRLDHGNARPTDQLVFSTLAVMEQGELASLPP